MNHLHNVFELCMNGSFLGGAERRGNLAFSNTDKGRDCFTSPSLCSVLQFTAMTVFMTLLREHQRFNNIFVAKTI
jgi:hypothetical protein